MPPTTAPVTETLDVAPSGPPESDAGGFTILKAGPNEGPRGTENDGARSSKIVRGVDSLDATDEVVVVIGGTVPTSTPGAEDRRASVPCVCCCKGAGCCWGRVICSGVCCCGVGADNGGTLPGAVAIGLGWVVAGVGCGWGADGL